MPGLKIDHHAFIRAEWDETETITARSAWKTGLSFLFGGRYRHSPVSALYVFGRRQDAALQKARGTIHERNHLRLWLAPATFQGKPVWLGQISRNIGVRFSKRTIAACFAKRVIVVQPRQRLDQSMLAVTAKPSFSSAFRIMPVLHADSRK